ncbi:MULTISPECIES: hypothetical protein [Hyphomicrobiales]|jgi:hypothetical protein|uniref:hypothetical protein n=1 Tax=Hyphomicrobiales TaxID=356 RepID=UPI00069184B1|nr:MULTISPECIES: hypothetical protein [Hyphomicrobiales]RKD74107.1 hypothetical protein BJ928_101456 [Rhizobium sp. WW_1]RZS83897.1 hypothetical protein EV217_2648 [Phyllobacterium myrsinacearum]
MNTTTKTALGTTLDHGLATGAKRSPGKPLAPSAERNPGEGRLPIGGLRSTTILNSFATLMENLMRKAKAALKRVLYTRAGVTMDNTIPDTTTYLVPDRNHFGVIQMPKDGSPTGEVWIEPGSTTGTRDVDFVSTASFRGAMNYADFNRQLVMESTIEGRFIVIAMSRRDIVEIRDQWPRVEWVDQHGEVHETTFDFWIRLADGTCIAVAVKPVSKVRSSGILDTLAAVQAQGIGGFADRVALVTEVYANHDAAFNAGWKLHARRMRNQSEYLEAFGLVSATNGSVRFHDLLQGAKCSAGRRIALWNLIDEAVLVPVGTGRIDDLSFLRRATSN